jgi:putative nucleotidyltransferase with HDIG domain
MPKTDVHIAASVRKTGKGHHAVHGFVDFEGKKHERHDITRMLDFEIGSGKNIRLYRVAREDVELMRKAGVSEDDIQRCLMVARKSLEIACRTGTEFDLELIGRRALFHDLGKSKTRAIEHGKNDSTLKRDLDYHREIQAMMDNS